MRSSRARRRRADGGEVATEARTPRRERGWLVRRVIRPRSGSRAPGPRGGRNQGRRRLRSGRDRSGHSSSEREAEQEVCFPLPVVGRVRQDSKGSMLRREQVLWLRSWLPWGGAKDSTTRSAAPGAPRQRTTGGGARSSSRQLILRRPGRRRQFEFSDWCPARGAQCSLGLFGRAMI